MISLTGCYVSATVLAGLWVIPLFVLWIVSLCTARRQKDPARVGIAWLKAAFPFFIIGLLLSAVRSGLRTWIWLGGSRLGPWRMLDIELGQLHVGAVAYFLQIIGDILLFITFVELALGFLLCLKAEAGVQSRLRTVSRRAVLAWGFIIFAVSLAGFGFSHYYYDRYIREMYLGGDDGSYDQQDKDASALNNLSLAGTIIMWVASLPILGLVALVMHNVKHHPVLRGGASLLLAAAVLNFVRHTVVMAIWAYLYNPPSSMFEDYTNSLYALSYIVEPVFNYVFLFVVLVLLFVLAIRKHQGLWWQPRMEQQQTYQSYPGVVYVQQQPQPGMMPMPMPMQQQPMGNNGMPMYGQYVQQPPQPAYQPQGQQQVGDVKQGV